MTDSYSNQIIYSRKSLLDNMPISRRVDEAAEGGCGVLGFASNVPVAGKHVLAASYQMHNRGNGKGGGIAMVGLNSQQLRVDNSVLRTHYILQIALLDPSARKEVEEIFINPNFEIAQAYQLLHVDDYQSIPGLEVRPPDVARYFVRVKPEILDKFCENNNLGGLSDAQLEDEFIYQNSFLLNKRFYASLGEKRAFVLSHGKNLSVLKIVGYAEDVVAYYGLENETAYVWIAHQRYPTKGRVWHPGGAHPFIGLNEALVHNGDFANYHAVSEYLLQRNIGQLFLTDTEVSVQLFDLWNRVYGYPLEITLEALAPTTEYDFDRLPEEKKALYQAVQRTHMHGSPDGPWFFILARSGRDRNVLNNEKTEGEYLELLGITDTSMLRPQVFALYENEDALEPVQIGLIASERQAINACLRSLASEDERYQPYADRYWVARGGSHTDGGAFRFTITIQDQNAKLVCHNKFGLEVQLDHTKKHLKKFDLDIKRVSTHFRDLWAQTSNRAFDDGGVKTFWEWLQKQIPNLTWDELAYGIEWMTQFAKHGEEEWEYSREILSLLRDRRYNSGDKKRGSILGLVDHGLTRVFYLPPDLGDPKASSNSIKWIRKVNWNNRFDISESEEYLHKSLEMVNYDSQPILVIDATDYPPEGDDAVARWIVRAIQKGWQQIIVHGWRGGRFGGAGLGPQSNSIKIDMYGDVGDYAFSGLDGGQITLHGDGQDQLGQIVKSGKLVIHGDAGQTFLYGAKGGEVFVLGSVAGRPLINAVGKPRVVINGTCLDYLAESFMAGDPLNGGGFVIVNGVTFDDMGQLIEFDTPYPGGNLFSLASGGAIYIRDPYQKVNQEQLNGGRILAINDKDWAVIEPYLRENERLFGIPLENLLTVDDARKPPSFVYRKVVVDTPQISRIVD